ncbi:hypothetical protein BPNPMPFG_003357 [Mesorhizobium sp. AR07]|uniref:hypothetical protein n=1 Tax=Mesorhizobium sp. AR07 TaxID=2865838 RepID=UPI0021608614|nr:hypothetical protein [Mesorhizobium sp. AR07]UVK47570.1 hypothetical protein BPNPMPFG_003357 [Mesorhizobium sp. AR07]
MVERNQREFKAQFGSFEDAEIDIFWLGTSENGKFLAFQFYRPEGSIHRFALPSSRVSQFVTQLAGTTDEMNDRQVAAALAKAEPKGQA